SGRLPPHPRSPRLLSSHNPLASAGGSCQRISTSGQSGASKPLTPPLRFAIILKTCVAAVAGLGARTTFRVSILASGSSGNITLLETTQTRLLIDAGLGKRETLRRLAAVEKRVDRLDGILISHEHADHIGGLPQVLAQWRTAVYLTEPTHEEARRLLPEGSAKRTNRVQSIRAGQRCPIGDSEEAAFSPPHDAADPVGFTPRANGAKVKPTGSAASCGIENA